MHSIPFLHLLHGIVVVCEPSNLLPSGLTVGQAHEEKRGFG